MPLSGRACCLQCTRDPGWLTPVCWAHLHMSLNLWTRWHMCPLPAPITPGYLIPWLLITFTHPGPGSGGSLHCKAFSVVAFWTWHRALSSYLPNHFKLLPPGAPELVPAGPGFVCRFVNIDWFLGLHSFDWPEQIHIHSSIFSSTQQTCWFFIMTF